MEDETNGEYPKEVIERLKGYADRTGKKIPRIEEKDFSNVEPIKKDTNLSSLLNSNGSNKIDVILARQPVIHEA